MECEYESGWLSNKDYLKQFYAKALKERIPLSGSIELTRRCNFNCIHCYLGDKGSFEKSSDGELNTQQWIHIIDEITEAGCLNLLITGGDPLIREDFSEIYAYAKNKGLLITVFTNAYRVNDEHLRLFEIYPPRKVEISIYGATDETYNFITGVRNAYQQCMKNIRRLSNEGISLGLKTMLMYPVNLELKRIAAIADSLGARFRFDPLVFATLDGDKGPLQLRVDPQIAVNEEFKREDLRNSWLEYHKKFRTSDGNDDLYVCGAGKTNFHINSKGKLQPCVLAGNISNSLLGNKFKGCWDSIVRRIEALKVDQGSKCRFCDKKHLCGYCPAFFRLENGAESKLSDFICRFGELRLESILNYLREET